MPRARRDQPLEARDQLSRGPSYANSQHGWSNHRARSSHIPVSHERRLDRLELGALDSQRLQDERTERVSVVRHLVSQSVLG